MRGSVAIFTALVLEVGVQTHDFINLDLQTSVPQGEVGINVPYPSACPRWGMIFLQRNFVPLRPNNTADRRRSTNNSDDNYEVPPTPACPGPCGGPGHHHRQCTILWQWMSAGNCLNVDLQ